MKTFRWGIVGPGSIAEEFVKDLAFVKNGKHSVKSILSDNAEHAKIFAEKFNVANIFTDMQTFLQSKVDAVYIATPHTLHYEQALACLEFKIPVLCEKPITINQKQLLHLTDTAVTYNTFFMEGMWIRFLPSIKKVLELIRQHKIGDITSVKASISYRAPKVRESRYFNPDLGGGSLLDLGMYPAFLATLLLGKPSAVKAVAAVSDRGVDEACSILLDYPDKQYAMLESSLITKSDLIAEIVGQKGKIKILSPWNETPEAIQLDVYDDYKVEYPCRWEGRGFQFEVDEMIQCLNSGTIESTLMPHELSMQVMEIMDEVREQVNVKYAAFE